MHSNLKLLCLSILIFNILSCQPEQSSTSLKGANKKSEHIFRNIYRVIDGDTFWLKDKNGQIEKVRLIGIDAPESRRSKYKDIQRFGKESKDFLVKFLKNKKVALEYDVQKTDQYGRTLAYVYLEDGTFLNNYLIRNGYAKVVTFPPNVKYHKQMLESERYARKNKLGMWKEE